MTKEKIEARLKYLQEKLNESLSTTQALHGAIQDCQYWLVFLATNTDNEAKQAVEGNNG